MAFLGLIRSISELQDKAALGCGFVGLPEAEDVVQWLESLLSLVIYTYNPSTGEVGGLRVQGHSWVHTKLEASLGYTRPCLKKDLFKKIYCFICVSILPVCTSVYHMCVHGCQRRELDPTEMVVSHCVDARNQT